MTSQERRCVGCNKPLSRYNSERTCAACAVAMRSEPAVPVRVDPELWFRPDMRHALAHWDWYAVLTAVAQRTGATQTQLAQLTGLSQAHVSRLMNNTSQCYDIRTIGRIVDGLGAPRLLAGLAP